MKARRIAIWVYTIGDRDMDIRLSTADILATHGLNQYKVLFHQAD